MARLEGVLLSPDVAALDARLDAVAATVCAQDPRTREQCRADALGAFAVGADRLGCRMRARRLRGRRGRRQAPPVVIMSSPSRPPWPAVAARRVASSVRRG
uniref:13E12 repeat family protein n=1 Tax=Mycobacterium tilburgii TaxID=44467 RepID=UPI0021B181E1|nr:13E12 repeat family protein [Mycobacterium tilburgii]